MNAPNAPFTPLMERRLLMKSGGNGFEEIVIRVGQPEDWGTGDWRVPVDCTPWHMVEVTRIAGNDAIHAMELALEFVERALVSTGEREFFFLPHSGEPPEPYHVFYRVAVTAKSGDPHRVLPSLRELFESV